MPVGHRTGTPAWLKRCASGADHGPISLESLLFIEPTSRLSSPVRRGSWGERSGGTDVMDATQEMRAAPRQVWPAKMRIKAMSATGPCLPSSVSTTH